MAQAVYISIKEAAKLVGKSPQTIRRLIKANKIEFKRDETPQGFNYEIDRGSVLAYYGMEEKEEAAPASEGAVNAVAVNDAEEFKKLLSEREHKIMVEYAPVAEFNKTLQALIQQHAREKENLFQLVEAFQDKVVSLETEKKVMQEQGSKPWFKFW